MNKARRQAKGVAAINRIQADLSYDYQTIGPRADGDGFGINPWAEPKAPKWLVKLVGIDLFAKVTVVDFRFSGVEERDLEILKDLPDIQCLELGGSKLSKTAAPLLIELRNLQYLGLEQTGLDDAAIAKIQTALPHCRIKRSD